MHSFFNDTLLLIYSAIFFLMDSLNSIFFPDGWIKFITIPLVILFLTYYFITSYILDKKKSYIGQVFSTFMMVFAVYFAITGWSFWMKTLVSAAIDRKEISLQLENNLIKKEIRINGKLQANAIKLINSFKKIKDISRQGSYRLGDKIDVEIISSKQVLNFQLQKDSQALNDYWVFFFNKKESKYKYLGHIKTDFQFNTH